MEFRNSWIVISEYLPSLISYWTWASFSFASSWPSQAYQTSRQTSYLSSLWSQINEFATSFSASLSPFKIYSLAKNASFAWCSVNSVDSLSQFDCLIKSHVRILLSSSILKPSTFSLATENYYRVAKTIIILWLWVRSSAFLNIVYSMQAWTSVFCVQIFVGSSCIINQIN